MAKPKGLTKFLTRAYSYVKDPGKVKGLLKAVVAYAKSNKGPVKRFFKDVQLLREMVVAWYAGRYKELPRKTIILIVAAMMYFIAIIDLIPDVLPGGFIDDAAVFAWVIQSISDDISKFKRWKSRSKRIKSRPVRVKRQPRK